MEWVEFLNSVLYFYHASNKQGAYIIPWMKHNLCYWKFMNNYYHNDLWQFWCYKKHHIPWHFNGLCVNILIQNETEFIVPPVCYAIYNLFKGEKAWTEFLRLLKLDDECMPGMVHNTLFIKIVQNIVKLHEI